MVSRIAASMSTISSRRLSVPPLCPGSSTVKANPSNAVNNHPTVHAGHSSKEVEAWYFIPKEEETIMSMLKDFRDFIGKGNAIDLAVGVILGSAISSILKSFVDELIVPLTGLLSKTDFSNSYFVLKGSVPDGAPLVEARKIAGVVALGYGQFVTVLINTLILAFAVFIVVRMVSNVKKRMAAEEKAAPPPAPAPPPADVVLLTEIRDLLRK